MKVRKAVTVEVKEDVTSNLVSGKIDSDWNSKQYCKEIWWQLWKDKIANCILPSHTEWLVVIMLCHMGIQENQQNQGRIIHSICSN